MAHNSVQLIFGPDLSRSESVRWVSLDAPMQPSALGDPTLRDEFAVAAYNNNNGTQSWAGSWVETGDGTSSPTSGSVKIASGALQLANVNRKLSRSANLVSVASATLSFQYKRSALDNASDYIALEISSNGGTAWTELARYIGPGTDKAWQSASFNILGYVAPNTLIRFSTSSVLGSTDLLYVDNLQIEYTPPPSAVPDGTVNTGALLNAYNQAVGADRLWAYGYQGSSVTVAVVDSGWNNNSDFRATPSGGDMRLKTRVGFNGTETNLDDHFGHGVHVAGIIGGNGSTGSGKYIGVAPKVQFVSVKVNDSSGQASTSGVVAGLQWIYDNKDVYNIRIVNLSLNSSLAESYHTSPLDAAVEILWFKGIVVVVSAGNNGTSTLYPPANDPFVITVGATDDKGTASLSDDTVTSFSAYGVTEGGFAKPDLVAPGKNLVAPLASGGAEVAQLHPEGKVNGGTDYFRMSGTSMSAPVVSGAIALLLQDEPNLTPDQVKYRLMATANKTWPGYNAATAGAGYLDIYAAVIGTTTQSANTGILPSQLLSSGTDPITFGSVGWNSVGWNSVGWNSVGWNSVGWNSVGWNSDYWGP